MKVWDRAGIELATPGSAVRHASVARHVTDCATRYLIVSIPDLCSLTYSEDNVSRSSEKNLNGIIITFRVLVLVEREA